MGLLLVRDSKRQGYVDSPHPLQEHKGTFLIFIVSPCILKSI